MLRKKSSYWGIVTSDMMFAEIENIMIKYKSQPTKVPYNFLYGIRDVNVSSLDNPDQFIIMCEKGSTTSVPSSDTSTTFCW